MFKSVFMQMTKANTKPFNEFDSSQSKTLLGAGLINFRILFLKTIKLKAFTIPWSRLVHPITAEGKSDFF